MEFEEDDVFNDDEVGRTGIGIEGLLATLFVVVDGAGSFMDDEATSLFKAVLNRFCSRNFSFVVNPGNSVDFPANGIKSLTFIAPSSSLKYPTW